MRENKGMTQEVLSARADLSQANLSLIENGKAEPGLRTLRNIANALGVHLTELVMGTD